jgi:hypothetical protein
MPLERGSVVSVASMKWLAMLEAEETLFISISIFYARIHFRLPPACVDSQFRRHNSRKER